MDQATHNKIISFIWGILAVEKEAEGMLAEIIGGEL
jgi:hypothetical protein